MRVIKDYIGIGVLILDQPDALEATLSFVSSFFLNAIRKCRGIPHLPHANGAGSECTHASTFEISKMAAPPISKRITSRFLQGYMQKHISHIE